METAGHLISRRRALQALAVAGGLAVGRCARGPASGAAGPCVRLSGLRIRWVVPNAAGGGYDSEARLIAPFLAKLLGAEIVIDNVLGAGGIVGARQISAAKPDGSIIGIVGVPGLLMAALTGQTGAPNPVSDFTLLGRVGRSWHVWAAAARSSLRTLDDMLELARTRPIVFAINEVGSANFASITVAATLLGVDVDLVAGFPGNRAAALAAVRGEVDMVCYDFETLADLIEGGDVRPLLQISRAPISPRDSLKSVPCLGGDDGVARRRAAAARIDEHEGAARADALIDMIGAGRVIVAPPALDPDTRQCLEAALQDALGSPGLRAADDRLDAAAADVTRRDVQAAAADARLLVPIVRDRLSKMRT